MATNTKDKTADSVASAAENAKLEHTRSGVTTRDDALDLGVPMLPGSPNEPVGPEDALGAGAKRGDYTGRLGDSNYQPHETVAVSDPPDRDDAGLPAAPAVRVEAQRERASDRGDEKDVKGGVGTS